MRNQFLASAPVKIASTTTIARKGDWIETSTDRAFWPLDPRPEDVFIEDIAHSLSLQCRFAGHVRDLYSVAQHSVLVSDVCISTHKLWGLLHDASEAYVQDLITPIKIHLPDYQLMEARVQHCIAERFGLSLQMPQAVKVADHIILATELRDLQARTSPPRPTSIKAIPLSNLRIEPWASRQAEERFLERFYDLYQRRH